MTETDKANEEARIRRLIDDRVKAVRAKDVEAAMACVAPNIVSFDVVNPLLSTGSDSSRRRAERWFASFQGPIGFEISDLTIAASGDAAFCHGLHHVNAMKADGEKLEMWWRATICFQKSEGRWLITHEHNSVPFDMETGKASIDLKP
jgi:ketosteroid isomerase-like protein